ncbi:hypothetical protein GF386_06165 [Candidatus Pacearchaeota archaeon]|nr:hypothetical protein [Candidatus Pacearchaeota archaeon]MBD3283674.1 hypothetical protein [Candidatus Pacearchaeota archaeon]
MKKRVLFAVILALIIIILGFLVFKLKPDYDSVEKFNSTNESINEFPISGSYITWERALDYLHSGEVASIMQAHSLEVTLQLKNKIILKTTEPSIDEIFREVDKCGEVCKNIITSTE